jgi:hypothetical protein
MRGHDLLAITLYVPDATLGLLGDQGSLRRSLQDGGAGLDFVVPGWWEGSHTARLGPVPAPHESLPALRDAPSHEDGPFREGGLSPARRQRRGEDTAPYPLPG